MTVPLAAVPLWLTSWLTPIWLLCVGALLALAILGIAWAVLYVVRRAAAEEIPLVLREGVLLPITWIVVGAACFGVVGACWCRTRSRFCSRCRGCLTHKNE